MTHVVDLPAMAAAALLAVEDTLPEPAHLTHAQRIEAATSHLADQRPAAYFNQIMDAVNNAAGPCPCGPCRRADSSADTLHAGLSILRDYGSPRDEITATLAASFATYPRDLLLDELVTCTALWNLGPLEADARRVASALLERLAALGVARKRHRDACEIWSKRRLCRCPWEVLS